MRQKAPGIALLYGGSVVAGAFLGGAGGVFLAVGGAASVDHLHKVKAAEHLSILAQFAPLDVIDSAPL